MRQFLLLLSCAIALLCWVDHAHAISDGEVIEGAAGERIAEFVRSAEKHGFSGAVIAAKDGAVVAAVAVGPADLSGERANTPHTLLEIASVTKQFTAAAVMRLVQDGKLRLDDPISKHLPEGSVPENCSVITIEHLLRHTSGIPGANSQGGGDDITAVLPSFLSGGPRHDPGAHWEYWNQGYAILSEIISRASCMSYMDYRRTALFEPAGMNATLFTGDDAPGGALIAIGRSAHGPPRSALDHPYGSYGFQYRGMGGAVSTVWDLWRWDRALYGNEILNEDSKSQLFKPGLNDYALGWFVRREAHGRLVQSHGGGVRGFVCQVRRYPEKDAFIAVLANNDRAPLQLVVSTIEQLLFAEDGPRVDAELAAALSGEYRWKERGAVLKIHAAGPVIRSETHWSPRGPITHSTIEIDEDGAIHLNDGSDSIPITIERDGDGPVRSVSILGGVFERIEGNDGELEKDAEAARSRLPIDRGMNVMIATRPYDLNERGAGHLPAGLTFRVMPQYVGMGPDGRVIDERITLVVEDAANRFWPVIVRMDTDVAERLVHDLQAMIEMGQRSNR